MDRIKSALELAMERLQKEEKGRTQSASFENSQEYIKAATILGRSFLQEKTDKEEIGEKLGRYPEHSRAAAMRAFTKELASGMTLNNTPMVLEAIRYLRKDEQINKECTAAEQLYQQFRQTLEEKLNLLTEKTMQTQWEKLSRTGIKGSAIAGFNVKGTTQWQQVQEQIEEEYGKALQHFRNAISTEAVSD